jgi:hypothetical protein
MTAKRKLQRLENLSHKLFQKSLKLAYPLHLQQLSGNKLAKINCNSSRKFGGPVLQLDQETVLQRIATERNFLRRKRRLK